MWNSDIPAYDATTDPLYQTIPFFLTLEHGGRAHGVFFDNTYWSSFDMGKEARDQYSFGAEGGELNYYVIAGPDPAQRDRTVHRTCRPHAAPSALVTGLPAVPLELLPRQPRA